MERADSEAGYFMLMPYTMALTAQILHGIFAKRGMDTGDYIIPVTRGYACAERGGGGGVLQSRIVSFVSAFARTKSRIFRFSWGRSSSRCMTR